MIVWHFARVIAHLFEGLLTAALVFPFISPNTREKLIRRWSRRLLNICRLEVQFIDHGQAHQQALIISNHISWLDIFVLNTWAPCRFVAKSDIRSWPLIGWLCEKAGTIFLARGKQREVRRIYEGLVEQIHAGERIAFFPEGTTAAQGNLLPFHANLFEAAIQAQVPIQPFSLRYLDAKGKYHPAADFIGDMSFVESLFEILKAGKIQVELVRLPQINTQNAHRRDVAQLAHEAVALSLGNEEAVVESVAA